MRRRTFAGGIGAAVATVQAPFVFGQSERTMKLVVPFPPGGATDMMGRVLAQKMAVLLRRPVIVENKAGAAGALGSEFVSRAAPDGDTLLLGTISTHATGPVMSLQPPYDPVKDFTPITLVADSPLVFMTPPTVGARNLREFVRVARSNPQLAFGSNGYGSYNHLAVELFEQVAGVDLLHVPYKGAGPVMNDLMAGHIQFAAGDLAGATTHLRAGKLKVLAVAAPERVPGFDFPTLIESGYPGFEVSVWYALFGPPNMAQGDLSRIHSAVVESAMSAEFRDRLQAMGTEVRTESPAALRQRVQREIDRWSAVVKTAKLSPQ